MTSTFNPLVPNGLLNLSVDYKNLQLNFQQLDTSFGKDHIKFSITPNNGYHTVIHCVPFSTLASNPPNNYPISQLTIPPSAPLNVSGIGELFVAQTNDGIFPDEQLYYQSGGGRLIQMTRNFIPTLAANGATFLPGGLILNWGQAVMNVNASNPTNITFTQAYASNSTIYSITTGYGSTSTSTTAQNAFVFNITKTGFSVNNTSSSSSKILYWMAIGS
jgi:hypothetical protein